MRELLGPSPFIEFCDRPSGGGCFQAIRPDRGHPVVSLYAAPGPYIRHDHTAGRLERMGTDCHFVAIHGGDKIFLRRERLRHGIAREILTDGIKDDAPVMIVLDSASKASHAELDLIRGCLLLARGDGNQQEKEGESVCHVPKVVQSHARHNRRH